MDFCPNCGSRLVSHKKRDRKKITLLLSCPKCDYEKKTTPLTITGLKVTSHPSKEQIAIIDRWAQKIRTSPKIRIECPRCGNKFVYAWSAHIRRLEESSTQFFRCTKCSHTFRETS